MMNYYGGQKAAGKILPPPAQGEDTLQVNVPHPGPPIPPPVGAGIC